MASRKKRKKGFFTAFNLKIWVAVILLALVAILIFLEIQKVRKTASAVGYEIAVFAPTHDSYVSERRPNANYGSTSTLKLSYSPSQVGYLKFNLTASTGLDLTEAKLRLHRSGKRSETNQTVERITNNNWTESTITYANRPLEDANAQKYTGTLTSGDWLDFDILDIAKGALGNELTILVKTPSGSIDFNSEESSSKPKLILTYVVQDTPAPTPTPTTVSTPTPVSTPLPTGGGAGSTGSGFWISASEIMSRPMSGATWDQMKRTADGDVGAANMSDQDSTHPEKTLGLALVAVRTGDASYMSKAANELVEAIGTEKNTDPNCDFTRSVQEGGPAGARGLAVGRNLLAYVVAADVMNFRDGGYNPDGKGKQFQDWVNYIRFRDNCPNNGSGTYPDGNWYNLSQVHDSSVSNGNALGGAARIAAAAYLGDKAEIDKGWLTYRRYAGDRSVGPTQSFNSGAQSWIHDLSAPVGVNPRGATCHDKSYPADGVLPNDQGRGGDCPSVVGQAPGYTQYPWEGLQGAYAQALALARLGYKDASGNDPWRLSDSAMLRAVEYQWYLQSTFGGVWYDGSRAAWVKHLANYIYGYKPAEYNSYGGGRNMDWTQWTHQ